MRDRGPSFRQHSLNQHRRSHRVIARGETAIDGFENLVENARLCLIAVQQIQTSSCEFCAFSMLYFFKTALG